MAMFVWRDMVGNWSWGCLCEEGGFIAWIALVALHGLAGCSQVLVGGGGRVYCMNGIEALMALHGLAECLQVS